MRGQRWKSVLVLLVSSLLFSCSRSAGTKPGSENSQVKAHAGTVGQTNKEPQADGLIPPETVRSEGVRIESGVKMLTVGNAQGHYHLSCNTSQASCLTPTPGKDYLLFTKATKWKLRGAKNFMTLEWLQSWSGSYNNEENIALFFDEGGGPIGMYWLRSWDKR